MDRSLKRRTLLLVLSMLLIAGALAPTFFSDSLPSWFPFSKKIVLGLDLQGGSHYVYRIDLDKVISDKAENLKGELESKLSNQDEKEEGAAPKKKEAIAATVKARPNG